MDILLNYLDDKAFNSLYTHLPAQLLPTFSDPTNPIRQFVSLYIMAFIGVHLVYFIPSTLSYIFLFDKELEKHPKFLKNQIRKEIWLSVKSFPLLSLVTILWFFGEVRGYSKLYHNVSDYGWPYFIFSILFFIAFTDCGVYWIHRFEHHPSMYWWLHKQHHTWKVSTPFASFAFHPLDGYFQSIPYHVFVYLFPFNSWAYLIAFVLIQMWTVSIHDGAYFTSHPWINSSAHHSVHHLEFNYNYGQYFTLWDRIGGSYRRPTEMFENDMFWDRGTQKKEREEEEKVEVEVNGKVVHEKEGMKLRKGGAVAKAE